MLHLATEDFSHSYKYSSNRITWLETRITTTSPFWIAHKLCIGGIHPLLRSLYHTISHYIFVSTPHNSTLIITSTFLVIALLTGKTGNVSQNSDSDTCVSVTLSAS